MRRKGMGRSAKYRRFAARPLVLRSRLGQHLCLPASSDLHRGGINMSGGWSAEILASYLESQTLG